MTLVLSYMSLHINCAASISSRVQKHAMQRKLLVAMICDLSVANTSRLSFFKEKEK